MSSNEKTLEQILAENESELRHWQNGHPVFEAEPDSSTGTKGFNRRAFLKGTGVLVVTLGVAKATDLVSTPTAEAAGAKSAEAAMAALADPDTAQVDPFLSIAGDGTVTYFSSRAEFGNGSTTGAAQVVAEELDVAFAKVRGVLGDTTTTPNIGGIGGSTHMLNLRTTPLPAGATAAARLRYAAATARQQLLKLASTRLGVPVDQLTVKEGVISVKSDASKRVTYGELIGGKRFQLAIDPNVPLKAVANYTIVGQSLLRPDVAERVTARIEFVQDVRVPGMLHARIIRPIGQPRDKALKLVKVDESSVAGLPGLVKVLTINATSTTSPKGGTFLAVVCEREDQAIRAAEKLKVTWEIAPTLPGDHYAAFRKDCTNTDSLVPALGDVDSAMAGAARIVQATYKFPYQVHGMIGPSCAVADVKTENGKVTKATVWAGTQNPYATRGLVGVALGVATTTGDAAIADKVQVIWRDPSGCYGRLLTDDVAIDAALVAQALGRPVRVQWSRADEHGWESYGISTLFDMRGALDARGNLVAYEMTSFGDGPNAAAAGTHYVFPASRYIRNRLPTGVPSYLFTSALRAPGAPMTAFASESFIDELAAAAKVDPLAFRLRYQTDPQLGARRSAVLQAAADKFGWDSRPSPLAGNSRTGVVRGRGIAYGPWSDTRVAAVAEVEVDQSTGQVRVLRVVEAVEAGLIVNPDNVRQQMEGCIIQGVGRTLLEEVKWSSSNVTSLDWVSYPTVTFSMVPKIETVIINLPNQSTSGMGEPPIVPIPAAIANAIFDATGARVRQVAMTPERVKAALAART